MKFNKLLNVVIALVFMCCTSVVFADAVPENANPLRSPERANQGSFVVDNYGKEITKQVDALSSRVVGDVQGAIRINSWGNYYQDGTQYWPYPVVTQMGNYYADLARELGLRVRIVTPRSANPNISVENATNSDPNGIAYIIVEVGPEDASESVMILTHMDTQTDSMRFDYESAKGLENPTATKHWNLGGFLSGKAIIHPTTGRLAIVGRGTDDDKITAIPEMYALKALQDSGVPLKRKVQILLGTNEENGGNRGAQAFTRLETFPKVSYVADVSDGSLRLTQPTFWYARGVLSWANAGNDDITLRFPAALQREEYVNSNTVTNVPGTFARWKASYGAYHIGSLVGSTQPTNYGNWGLQLKTAAWLVCKDPQTALELYNNAMSIRNSYIDKYWTYLENQNYYRPFIEKPTNIDESPNMSYNPRLNPDGTPEEGRWDIGIDVELVKSPGSDAPDTVQIITRGLNWRYTEQFGQNSRHILMDFLANLPIPSGKTARWSEAAKRISQVFPYGQPADQPGKDSWRAAHLFDAVGVQAYFNEFTPSLTTDSNLAALGRTVTIAAASWDIDVSHNVATPTRPAARTGATYGGNNTADVGQLYFELRFLYPMAPYDEDWFVPSAQAKNRDYLPGVQAEKVRAAMAAAGIGTATLSNTIRSTSVTDTQGFTSYNETSSGSGIGGGSATFSIPQYYSSYTHDCVQFALRSTNAYYKANDIPWRETLCGQNGTNYGVVFRIGSSTVSGNVNGFNAPPVAGTAVGLGHWGGKNGLHSYNENVEINGLLGYANRVAAVLGDAAQGRYHTYDVSGNGSTQERMVLRLENVQGTPTYTELSNTAYTSLLKEDVYVQEASELPVIMESLKAKGILPADSDNRKSVDFLFGRKFLMKGIPAGGDFELTVNVGPAEGKGAEQYLVVAGELADGSGWDVISSNPADVLNTIVKVPAAGSKFDKDASANIVNTRVATFLVTNQTFIGATPFAEVIKLNGNKNTLIVTVIEEYTTGKVVEYEEVFSINNNAADTYQVGPYIVYVDTKGNTQIRECYIKEELESGAPSGEPIAAPIVTPSARVEKLSGNTNNLFITVKEVPLAGAPVVFEAKYSISNNASGTYAVGPYNVYVATKGNDKIEQCYVK